MDQELDICNRLYEIDTYNIFGNLQKSTQERKDASPNYIEF